ncbi:MAG: RecQ family ATP-dependent DNA helicase [Treponema sp.]|nr:RecQ family ATP-dependent DNA helicase [Treponema sp.]
MDENKFDLDPEELYSEDLISRLAFEKFGIKYIFPWQRLVVSNILEAIEYHSLIGQLDEVGRKKFVAENSDSFCLGRQIVLLPTGAGKSLCFQLPALVLDGPTLVIYPLLALMTDQQRRMEEGSLRSVLFRGGQSREERNSNFGKLKSGQAKIILANPEVLESEDLLEELKTVGIKHIAIDEAHCVSEWGRTFRKSYLSLGKVIKKLDPPVITAFTATASPEVLANVAEILFDGEAHIVRSESDRRNIIYYVTKAASKKKEALRLVKTELHPMIIFCGTRNKAEDMAREINMCYGDGSALFYHAGLEKEEKDFVEHWFYESKDGVLCATCAYGMGVDKKDIKTVVHLEVSATAEAYIQEAGRGGRDGSIAKAILIWSPKDSLNFSAFKADSRETALKNFAETEDCRRQVLLDALGAEQAVCSGCDLCDAKKQRNELKSKWESYPVKVFRSLGYKHDLYNLKKKNPLVDYEYALKLIKNHRNYFTQESLESELMKKMNGESRKFCGKNIWNHSDLADLLSQLKEKALILERGFLWKNKLTINKRVKY